MGVCDANHDNLIYINPITLSTMNNGSRRSTMSPNNQDYCSLAQGSLQMHHKLNVDHPCPVHRCLSWLSDNRGCITKIPSDIVSDYQNWYATIDRSNANRFTASTFRRAVALLKMKMYPGKLFQTEFQRKEELKQKMRPSDYVGKKNSFRLPNLNYNTNKPCCTKKETSEEDEWIKSPQRILKRSYHTDTEEKAGSDNRLSYVWRENGSLPDGQEKRKGDGSSPNELTTTKKPITNKSIDEGSETNLSREWRSGAMPMLTMNKKIKPVDEQNLFDGQSLTLYLRSLSRRFSKAKTVPEEYKVCYKFYLYLYPSLSDNFLLIFQRHGLKDLTRRMDPFDVQQMIVELKADFLFDRRLEMVQNHSKTHIVLLPLSMKFINGLPHRPVHIYSENYENIAKAMSILEEAMPDVIERAVFRNNLPSTLTTKWSSKGFIFRPYLKRMKRYQGHNNWQSRINMSRIFPTTKHVLNPHPRRQSSDILERRSLLTDISRPRSLTKLSIPGIKGTSGSVTAEDSESTDTRDKDYRDSNSSNRNNQDGVASPGHATHGAGTHNVTLASHGTGDKELKRVKRIKCPASILTHQYFMDRNLLDSLCLRLNCQIKHLDPDLSGADPEKDRQVKLTILYKSKSNLQRFCRHLGLRLRSS